MGKPAGSKQAVLFETWVIERGQDVGLKTTTTPKETYSDSSNLGGQFLIIIIIVVLVPRLPTESCQTEAAYSLLHEACALGTIREVPPSPSFSHTNLSELRCRFLLWNGAPPA